MAVSLGPGDLVVLYNDNDKLPETVTELIDGEPKAIPNKWYNKELILKYHSKKYPVAPGRRRMIPFELFIKDFGDPRSLAVPNVIRGEGDTKYFIPSRAQEIKRLSGWYGTYEYESADILASAAPRIRAMDMDDNPILPIWEDPSGLKSMDVAMPEGDPDTAATIELMNRRIQLMEKQLKLAEEENRGEIPGSVDTSDDTDNSTEDDVTEDTPPPSMSGVGMSPPTTFDPGPPPE